MSLGGNSMWTFMVLIACDHFPRFYDPSPPFIRPVNIARFHWMTMRVERVTRVFHSLMLYPHGHVQSLHLSLTIILLNSDEFQLMVICFVGHLTLFHLLAYPKNHGAVFLVNLLLIYALLYDNQIKSFCVHTWKWHCGGGFFMYDEWSIFSNRIRVVFVVLSPVYCMSITILRGKERSVRRICYRVGNSPRNGTPTGI